MPPTGPRTDDGKARAGRNAIKHGFLAGIPREDADFHAMLQGLQHSLQPQDQLQQLLVEQIALAYLRLRRLVSTEHDAARTAPPARCPAAGSFSVAPLPGAHRPGRLVW